MEIIKSIRGSSSERRMLGEGSKTVFVERGMQTMTTQREKLIEAVKAEGISVERQEHGISCAVYVPDYCLIAFLEMVKTINKIESK